MNLLSSDVLAIFPYGRDESDSKTTELALMGEEERYQIEAEFKRLTDKIRDQQDLLNKRESDSKEEATKLKANLELFKAKYLKLLKDQQEEESKIRKFFRDKNQKLHDEVTSLRKEVNEKNTTIKNLRDRSSDYESLEASTLSLKEDLEEAKKQNKDLLQGIEKQENEVISLKAQLECVSRVRQMLQDVNEEQEKEILNLRCQLEDERNAEENMKKQYLEKEEQLQVEVNILKGKLEDKDKLLYFKIVLRSWMIFLIVKGLLLSKLVLVFMNLLKVNLVHKVRQGTRLQNLKCSIRR